MGLSFAYHVVLITTCFSIPLVFYSTGVSGQILKRFDDITGWAVREEKIFELSKARVKRLKQELAELEKFVDDYEKTTSQHLSGMQDPGLQEILKTNREARAYVVASNPMLTYRMTHRLSTMLSRMQRALLTKDPEINELKEILGAFIDVEQHPNVTLEPLGDNFGKYFEWLPNEDDLEGALDAMTVLYDVYNPDILDPTDFAAMLSAGTSKPVHINAYHATKLSLKAFYQGYYGNAIDWATYANNKLDNERDYSISKELVHYMKEFMGKTHNEEIGKPPAFFPETISYLNFYTELANETKTWAKRKSNVEKFLAEIKEEEEKLDEKEKSFQLTTGHYYQACQKARLQEMKNETVGEISSKLTCRLDRNINPYHYLAPLKVEVLSESPRILQFYDLLSPQELEMALEDVKEREFKSPYQLKEFPDEFGTRKPHMRTVMDAVIDKQTVEQGGDTGVFRTLARKTEYLTEFKVLFEGVSYPLKTHSDMGFQAVEYVGGGFEAFQKRKEEDGKFGGGIQIYLQVPEEGGEIVFGGVKAIGKPAKGSAILWDNINIREETTIPVDLYVGSCPVIQGHKIVLTKDFYYKVDEFYI